MPSAAPPLYELLGGEPILRAIIERFIERLSADGMIGFLFDRVDRERLKQREFEFAAQHLGADVKYTGRPLGEAHRPHRIFGGQFARRLQILREVLSEFDVDPAVRAHWLAHTEALRDTITAQRECDP